MSRKQCCKRPVTRRFGLGLSVGAVSILLLTSVAGAGTAKASAECKTCIEKRPVLDPDLFARGYPPEVKNAYSVARRYPTTLDRIHCFCECRENLQFHHKTLLTCFTDSHAAGCGICVDEALAAARLKVKGLKDDQVARAVEGTFRSEGHPPTGAGSR